MAAPPKVLLFALCDGVVADPDSEKTSLIGVFDSVQAARFPAMQSGFVVYLRLTGMNGRYRLGIVLLEPDLETVVAQFEQPGLLVADDSLQVVETTIRASDVEYPAPGRYAVRLIYNARTADERTLRVSERP